MKDKEGLQEQQTRPPVAIGHVDLRVTNVAQATDFFLKLGMRHIHQEDDFAVLELRGGTHLLLESDGKPVEPKQPAPFDLMVDDLEVTRNLCLKLGMGPSAVRTGKVHQSFTVIGPDAYEITITSSHASGRAV